MNLKNIYLSIIIIFILSSFSQLGISNENLISDMKFQTNNSTVDNGIQVSIFNPANNSVIGDIVSIHISAKANQPIIKYEIYINNTLKAENFIYQWDTNTLSGNFTITARAYTDSSTFSQVNHVVKVDPSYKSGIFKFMTYNIYESGLREKWINVVEEENPDVLVLQETGSWNGANDPVFKSHLDTLNSYFVSELPYTGNTTVGDPTSTGGVAIITRYPIIQIKELSTLYLDDNSPFTPQHNILDSLIQIGQMQIHFITIHLACCETGTNGRIKDIEGLINYLDTLKDNPIVIAGDFNTFSPYDTGSLAPDPGNLDTQTLDMLLNSSNPKYSSANIWTDTYRELNPHIPGYSYVDILYESRIDYIFVNSYLKNSLVNSTVGDTPSAVEGSDHFCVDAYLNLDYSTNDLRPPYAPIGLNASIIDNNKVNLNWISNTEPDLDYYNIYRNNLKIGSNNQASYQDLTVPVNQIVRYSITAIDNKSNEGFKSRNLLLNTSYGIITEPDSPSLTINSSEGTIVLTWNTPNNGGIKIDLYKIYRKSGSRWLFWGVSTNNSFTDKQVNPNFTYTYYIIAVNEVGQSIPSNQASLQLNSSGSASSSNPVPILDIFSFLGFYICIVIIFKKYKGKMKN